VRSSAPPTTHNSTKPPHLGIVRTAKGIPFWRLHYSSKPHREERCTTLLCVVGAFCPWLRLEPIIHPLHCRDLRSSNPSPTVHQTYSSGLSFYAPRKRNLWPRSSSVFHLFPRPVLLLNNHPSVRYHPEVYTLDTPWRNSTAPHHLRHPHNWVPRRSLVRLGPTVVCLASATLQTSLAWSSVCIIVLSRIRNLSFSVTSLSTPIMLYTIHC
jgi:hypothetical protein